MRARSAGEAPVAWYSARTASVPGIATALVGLATPAPPLSVVPVEAGRQERPAGQGRDLVVQGLDRRLGRREAPARVAPGRALVVAALAVQLVEPRRQLGDVPGADVLADDPPVLAAGAGVVAAAS